MNFENQNPELRWAAPLVVWKAPVSLSAGSSKQAFFLLSALNRGLIVRFFWGVFPIVSLLSSQLIFI